MGQRWACASEPDWKYRWINGSGGYQRKIVYCDTDKFSPPTREVYVPATRLFMGTGEGRCDLLGGKASWQRCSTCPHREGESAMSARTLPPPVETMCPEGDLTYNPRRKLCRRCQQRFACWHAMLREGRRVGVRLIRFSRKE